MDLPRELTSFVGREREILDISRLLAEAPLVTLAGPGGAGKSRLALRAAHEIADAFADGVDLVELAPLSDPALVDDVVADSLGITGGALAAVLHSQQRLLVLDNCEHLLDASSALAHMLLRACPRLRIIATSREPLAIEGEMVFRVPPLEVSATDAVEALLTSEAGQLFVQRARTVRNDFQLQPVNAPAVARICRRLDGLPLAIELAANRVAVMAPAEIAVRLDEALPLLATGQRTAPERQRTLEAAIDWSYRLLDPQEQREFERLAVFAGGFSIDAVADVEVLARLVATSMVHFELQGDDIPRYRLLEPLRQFGLARLTERGDLDSARRGQFEYVLALAEQASPELFGPHQIWWNRRLNGELDNIRIADDWAYEQRDTRLALRLGAALAWWWSRPDRQSEGRLRLERALSLPGAEDAPAARARVATLAALLAEAQSDMAEAPQLTERALALTRAHGDALMESLVLVVMGRNSLLTGNPDAALRLVNDALRIARAAQLGWAEARALDELSAVALARDDLASAEEYARASLGIARASEDTWGQGMALNSLGDVLRSRGDIDQAGAAYEKARAFFLPLMEPRSPATQGLLHNLGYVALGRGDPGGAAALFLEAADQYRRVGADRRGLAECLLGLAAVALSSDRVDLAARLFASLEAALAGIGSTVSPSNRLAFRDVQRAVRRLDEPPLPLEAALELARALSTPAEPSVLAELTQREREVARLLARGFTNRQIADALVITESTAKNHTQRVLDKLGVASRAQVAARAAELGLRDSPSA